MTIRPARREDVPDLVAMAERFVAATSYREHFTLDLAHLTNTVTMLVERGGLFVAQGASGDLIGLIAIHVFQHPFTGVTMASELAWWVEPHHRGRTGLALLKHAEAWAKAQGAEWLHMVAPTPEVEQMYERMHFRPVERSYQRRVN